MPNTATTDSDELLLREYAPRSQLVVKETRVEKPRFPVIDAHNHLTPRFGGPWNEEGGDASALIDIMDEAGIRAIVDLCDLQTTWRQQLERLKAPYPERFFIFGHVDFARLVEYPNFGEKAARQLAEMVRDGIDGLKVWKNFGLHIRDTHGKLIPINDRRLDPLWAQATELNIPVLIHIADPVAFFAPMDRFNERREELHRHPDWHFYSSEFPAFEELIDQFADLLERHSKTTFIGAHAGCYSENLAWVSSMFERCPNFYVDISARIDELGRQPYTARRFFLKYPDRILFGTDKTPNVDVYRIHYRFLETDDEYFPYSPEGFPRKGQWQIYGLYLPDAVLKKVYYENAERVLSSRVGGK